MAAPYIFTHGGGSENSWTQASHFVTQSGHGFSSAQMTAFLQHHCANILNPRAAPPGVDPAAHCLDEVSKTFKLTIAYPPASRYWTFQWLETAIFILLALAAAGVTYWWVTRRLR